MSDGLPIPSHPDIENYRKRAKDLLKIVRTSDRNTLENWAALWLHALHTSPATESPHSPDLRTVDERLERAAGHVAAHIMNHMAIRGLPDPDVGLTKAQFAIAREHGFLSWTKFAAHVESVSQPESIVAAFELAADAIARGDTGALRHLLERRPDLVRARSTRDHRSTLLQYVSANGIEGFRQRTPSNIVEIARILLDSGADVNALSDAYGGGSTVLGLTATSVHPEAAGVQRPLMDLLIARGARVDGTAGGSGVVGCLHNGRGDAALYLAGRGAPLDLEGAAGVGDVDAVRTHFDSGGRLVPPATEKQLADGFAWACEYGHEDTVTFLLSKRPLNALGPASRGITGLHWAAYGGWPGIVRVLLDAGADPNKVESEFGGAPLGWALYGWGAGDRPARSGDYAAAVAVLVRAGAVLTVDWYSDDPDRRRALEAAQTDAKMSAALRGESQAD